MPSTREHRDAIRRAMKPVADFLQARNRSYAVVGSVAGMSHGYGRTTIDVDVLAEITGELAKDFEEEFSGSYYVDAQSIRDAVRWKRSFNLYHFQTGVKIDIFVSKNRPFDVLVLERRELENMDDDATPSFYVQTAEDLVLSKMQWYREANEVSDRQWNDILSVMKLQSFTLDLEYLEYWSKELNINDLLNKALDESGFTE